MDTNSHLQPDKLERYAFLWSLARMVIASLSLFFGAVPIIFMLGMTSSMSSFLQIAWLISGAASAYLIYRWHKAGQKVFSGKDKRQTIAFFVMVVTGFNLGFAAIGNNIGMSLAYDLPSTDLIFKATAIVYLVAAYFLWTTWKAKGEKLF